MSECCCCCSVIPLCPTVWDPMHISVPDLPVPHHIPKFAQVHGHCYSDAIQLSHPLTPSSPSALNLSGNVPMSQMLASDDQNTVVSVSASTLPMSGQGWSPLRLTALICLMSKGLLGIYLCLDIYTKFLCMSWYQYLYW